MAHICLITIGDELLKGRVVNTNATRAAEILRARGYTLDRVVTISDTRSAILDTVQAELAAHDVVLMCGGLGPTRDDITKYTLAALFGGEMVCHQPTLAFLEARAQARNRPLNDLTRGQAWVPDTCEVVLNTQGTAPGMYFRQGTKQVFAMPGVPFEMLYMLEHGVMPLIEAAWPPDAFRYRIVRLAEIPESDIARRMETLEPAYPEGLAVSYLPRIDGVWLEMTLRYPADRAAEADEKVAAIAARVEALFADKRYASGGEPLPYLLAEALRTRSLTLAVAESLTGGQVAALVVSVSGASHFFKGSVTAYDPAIKISLLQVPAELIAEHTVVSGPVASAMAAGVRHLLGTDIGIATTGLAEADGERAPQAWIGYADAAGSDAKLVSLYGNRQVCIEMAAHAALLICLKKLLGNRTDFQ
ncbi:MAG: nicotinamide-nucleotide amidohydrolase family protein [Bacteroidia bacterium]|nr:nicotinamide-nucleotide amidohydrolase family protein [Bacteroidia bacterium]